MSPRGDFARLGEQMAAAKAELHEAMEKASRDLLRFKQRNQPTERERQAMHEAALRGDLGADMQRLARRIENGEDSWDAVFSGQSPNAELLRGHLDRMIEQNRGVIAQSFEEDPDFDPSEPPRDGG